MIIKIFGLKQVNIANIPCKKAINRENGPNVTEKLGRRDLRGLSPNSAGKHPRGDQYQANGLRKSRLVGDYLRYAEFYW